ncbi:MAG: SDR family NAD(P)-dependent oxidoreductase [Halospina sp.]
MKTMIVGAGSGIGQGLAFEMASRGHDLVLVGRSREPLEDTGNEVGVRHSSKRPLSDLALRALLLF